MAAKIKFNRNQANNPTPANVVFWVRVGSAICGGLQTWMITATWMPYRVHVIIGSLLGLLTLVANIMLPFFGVEVKESKIPVEKVTAIETEPTTPKEP